MLKSCLREAKSQPGISRAKLVNKESSDIFEKTGGGSSLIIELAKRRRRAEYSVLAVSVLVLWGVPNDSLENDGISSVRKLTRF